jgi:hypothetical protein
VDRRFNRAAVDREQELARVRSLLRSETNPRVIGGAALEVVNRTLQPSTSGIWFAPDTSSAVSGSRARGSTIGAHVDSAG